jgi:hypothetical protein
MPRKDFKLVLMHYLEHKDLGRQVSDLIVLRGQAFTCIFDGFHEHRLQHSVLCVLLRDKTIKQCGCTS